MIDVVADPTADQRSAVAAVIARATATDGTAPLSEQAVRAVTSDDGSAHVLALDGETVVGYANVTADGAMAEAVVDPQTRGRGFGADLVDRALTVGGRQTRVWAHGQLPAAVRVAEKLGLDNVRELLQLRRPLVDSNPLPELVIPDGIEVRTYRPSDDAELLRVNNAAFAWHPEQGGWTQKDIDDRRGEAWFDPEGLFVATNTGESNTGESDTGESDTVLGFHWTKIHEPRSSTTQGDDPRLGEVYVVGIDPQSQGRGLGHLLTLAGLLYLQQAGLPAVLLYVESDNIAAVHTYEKLGFTRFHTDVAYARP